MPFFNSSFWFLSVPIDFRDYLFSFACTFQLYLNDRQLVSYGFLSNRHNQCDIDLWWEIDNVVFPTKLLSQNFFYKLISIKLNNIIINWSCDFVWPSQYHLCLLKNQHLICRMFMILLRSYGYSAMRIFTADNKHVDKRRVMRTHQIPCKTERKKLRSCWRCYSILNPLLYSLTITCSLTGSCQILKHKKKQIRTQLINIERLPTLT
jgi:hypothetical protein